MRQINPVTWSSDARPFMTCEPVEHFEMRKKAAKEGLGYVEFPHPTNPRYHVYRLLPLNECKQTGFDEFRGERFPRFVEVA